MPTGIYIRTKEHGNRISKARIGHLVSEETKKKISKSKKGYFHSKESKKKMSKNHKGVIFTDEHIKRMRKAHRKWVKRIKGKTYEEIYGIKKAKEMKRKLSKSCIRRLPCTEETRRKISEAKLKQWQNPEYAKKHSRAFNIEPNIPERRLRNGLNKMFPGEYKFVGDGKIWIVGKNPDFININGQKKIIELFGDYWHSKKKTGRTKKREERQRINHFAKYGFRTLIVWEKELKNIRRLKKKLVEFHIK